VTEAENGQVAVDALTAARPDVIILDLMMPTMAGFGFLDELGGRSDWHDIPVVVITGKDLTEEAAASSAPFKGATASMLRQLNRAISKCVKRQTTRVA
jgi:two-component system chemotaxis response regulator CheY